MVIAIDGPSGSGKSSAARQVAARLGWRYLDTGAMYRAAAIAHREAGHPDGAGTADAVEAAPLTMDLDPGEFRIRLGDRDVSEEIRDTDVASLVSAVAAMPEVRETLIAQQRRIISEHCSGIVVEGRDITTVVAPEAPVRVLLTASPEVRMRRRGHDHGDALSTEQLRRQVVDRDRKDSRVTSFEAPAPGVTLIDSSDLSLEQVVDQICSLAEEARVP